MATTLRMPDMGTVEGDVTIVRWLKAEGDTVSLGDPLFEAETDKGVSEVEAAMAGVLLKKLVAEGARAGAGEPIALIRRPGEPEESADAQPPAKSTPEAPPASARRHTTMRVPPVVRALAEKHGVDLAAVRGTGPAGRITREDVIAAKRGAAPVAAAAPAPARPSAGSMPAALSHAQSDVARKVSQSHREKPVYRVHSKADVGRVIAAREQAKARGTALSWDAVLVKACAMAVTEMPVFRRWLKGEEVAEHPRPDIAVAVGVGEDLVIPAVRGAAEKKVGAVSAEIAELARKAEARTLGPKEIEGSCLLVSNLGMFPVESFDAIVYPEHAAALAAGALTYTPVSDGVRTWIAALVHLTLTVDHRLINGRTAAQFIARVKQILETGEFA